MNNGETTSNGKQPGGCTGRGWRPGQSGNPKGRPKGRGLTDRLQAALDADDGAAADRIVAAVIEAAEQGDAAFVKLVFDRLEGKAPTQRDIAEARLSERADEIVAQIFN